MSCGGGRRLGSDPVLLRLWHRLAATAPIQPLARELPDAQGVALKKRPGKKKKNNLNFPSIAGKKVREHYKPASNSFKLPGGFQSNIDSLNSKGKKFACVALIEEIPVTLDPITLYS